MSRRERRKSKTGEARPRAWLSGASVGLAISICAIGNQVAVAQEAQDVAAARALGQKGTLAAQAGHCEEAVDLLSRARTLMSVPSVLTPLGECQIRLGKLVDGTESLQAAARIDLDASAPKAYVKAQAHAKELLAATLPRLAHLSVNVKLPKGVSFKVTDNGQPVSDALIGIDRPVDPGKHSIEVTAPGYLVGKLTITLTEGQRDSGNIEPAIDPNPPPAPTPIAPLAPTSSSSPPTETAPPPNDNAKTRLIAGGVTLGAGAVIGILGGVFGGLALSKKSSLNGVCTNRQCPATSQSDIDTMKTFANTSTAFVVIGGAAAASGIVVMVIGATSSAPPSSTAATNDSAPRPKVGVRVSPYIGVGNAGFSGSF